MTNEERIARWTAPLASQTDTRLHPSFERVRTETAKLESPSGGPPDWAEVLRASDAFLSEVGRDLVIGAALASALAHREGVGGATLGARTLTRLLADATLTPPRPRARGNALAWFCARAEVALDGAKDRERDELEALAAALSELTRDAARMLGDDAPSTRGLEERVRAALATVPAPASPPPPLEAKPIFALPPPPSSSPSSPMSSGDAALPDRPEQVPAFVRRTATQLVSAASIARGASALDPDALRLTLVALYLPITHAPETTRDARTALPAPPKLVMETLRKQETSASAEILVRDAISAIERHRFAFDAHAVLSRALERAGATRAVEVHRHELVGLTARIPDLLGREFADGSSFASPETRAMIEAWRTPASGPTVAARDEDRVIDRVQALARQGRAHDALEVGRDAARGSSCGRERFETNLAVAAIAEEARATSLAVDLYASLVDEIDRHALDAWEPTLVSNVLHAYARTLRTAQVAESVSRPVLARLARIDPAAAFELSRSSQATPAKTVR